MGVFAQWIVNGIYINPVSHVCYHNQYTVADIGFWCGVGCFVIHQRVCV
jgi:hypothetical protein